MEKFMHRDNVLVECAENSSKSPLSNSEETDFKDVFGGPPRRFSMQEVRVRYSSGETVELEEDRATSPWIVLKEKPVFGGEDSGARRRHQGNDFYDDIFGGDESYSSPRTSDHRDRDNSLGSIPGSRIMSPNRPFPAMSDIFGTSLPVQFSRSSKSTKQMELPAFGSKSPLSPSSSRYSHEAIRRSVEETRNENYPMFRPSPLSHHETSFSGEHLHSAVTFDQKGNVKQLIKETEIAESSNNENEFHFSIYKWAGLGLPMLLPLIGRNNCKSKDGNGNGNYIEPHSMKIVCEERDFRINEEKNDQQHYTELKSGTKKKDTVLFLGARGMLKSNLEKSLDESNLKEDTENGNRAMTEEPLKSELKPLHTVLDDEVDPRGTIKDTKKKNMRTRTKAQSYENAKKNVKKNTGAKIDLNGQNDENSKVSEVTPVKSGVRGKVRDFVHRFSQEAESKPKYDLKTQSQSFRMKSVGINKKEENEVKMNAAFETLDMLEVNKKPEVSVKVDEDLTKDEAQQYSFTNTDNFSSNQDNTFSSELLNKDSKISSEYSDDAFEDIFEVEELSEDHEKLAPNGEGFDDLGALDVKIQQWSFGKKGNIRSLLSTLQFVLWPESGWIPVPLMDLIEGNTVKRAYQKALLRLHPDKLQQKSAPSSHKYIAEKVFDILQEAWDHFNTLAPL